MPPQSSYENESFTIVEMSILEKAAHELKTIKKDDLLVPFPPNCFEIMRSISGNDRCLDCASHHPAWASVSYGALICMRCTGRHRSLGVQVCQHYHVLVEVLRPIKTNMSIVLQSSKLAIGSLVT